jgi:3-oxoacyl-[acyl-carrier protein] reductase
VDLGLKGKVALITGGSHGIGQATAYLLADEGCNVAVFARGQSRLSDTVAGIESRGVQGLAVSGDVMEAGVPQRVVDEVVKCFGTVHILVNNVGGGGRWGSDSVEGTADSVWCEVFEKNALTAARFTTLLLPFMRRQRWGRVVALASIYGREGGGRPWFNMAKAAQISMMKCLARNSELTRMGITFNSVAPGPIMIEDTEWATQRDADPAAFQMMLERDYILGRLGTTQEVAAVVAFLCSEQASLVNGASVAVDGAEGRAF